MPLTPMSNPGLIKSPVWQYADRNGRLHDWAGIRSAQGCVVTDRGTQTTSCANYYDPKFTAPVILNKTEDTLTMRVWNIDTQQFEDHDYPASELQSGVIGSTVLTQTIIDPQLNDLPARLCKYRAHLQNEV